ncbi:S-adenosyl-L-methionine-dependent methyltransferase [Parathielavia appendiculata]|uniref:S-adenosyl-L-methionine-dependent methyltransferase n=1 Tax=Parathielavia appendiculata TaxID=2587402 RepID=A0AAN6U3M8_9PEZI|nr:S-adenosyl-L-methionine-dependent methyltransferase [Parathielavia appendiculata]
MAQAVEQHIEIDSDDGASVNIEEISTFTASITSSILDYPVENGRRYHAFRAGVYCLPNDEIEQERLDLTHALMTKGIGDHLFLAPIDTDKMHRVLDIGTGTGIWAMCMGDEYPNAQVLGNDLSAIQPPWVPPNVKFEIDDVESPWVYEAPFDFIFCRYMCTCIKDWPALVHSVYDNLTPGGWAEFQDYDLQYYSEDGSLTPEKHTLQWINTLLEAARKTERDPCPGPKLEGWMRDAGFANVTHQRFRFPLGPWPRDPKLKEIGYYNLMQILGGLEAFSLRLFCHVLGWQREEVLVLLAKVRSELQDPKLHIQFDFHVAYGQKLEKKD